MSKLELELSVGTNSDKGGIMGGFNGKCKFTCFPCSVAWTGKAEEKDIECCPQCREEAGFIQSIEWRSNILSCT